MALKGEFTVNDADYSPLLMYGIGRLWRTLVTGNIAIVQDVLQYQTTGQYLMVYITSLSAQAVAGKV